jgi:hypothetical protein
MLRATRCQIPLEYCEMPAVFAAVSAFLSSDEAS